MSSTGLADLLSLSTLTSVDLSECLHVSGTEIVKGLKGSGAGGAQLESLNLKSCTYIRVSCCLYCKFVFVTRKSVHETYVFLLCVQDFAVFSFTQLLGDTLRELDLTSCVNVTDLSVRSIATYLQRLVVLRLGWCKEVTDWGLLGMVETTKCDPDQEVVRPSHVDVKSPRSQLDSCGWAHRAWAHAIRKNCYVIGAA